MAYMKVTGLSLHSTSSRHISVGILSLSLSSSSSLLSSSSSWSSPDLIPRIVPQRPCLAPQFVGSLVGEGVEHWAARHQVGHIPGVTIIIFDGKMEKN